MSTSNQTMKKISLMKRLNSSPEIETENQEAETMAAEAILEGKAEQT